MVETKGEEATGSVVCRRATQQSFSKHRGYSLPRAAPWHGPEVLLQGGPSCCNAFTRHSFATSANRVLHPQPTVTMRLLPSIARRTRTLLRRVVPTSTRSRPLLFFCFALTLLHYGSYRWLHTRYHLIVGILHADGSGIDSETAGSSTSNIADAAAVSSGSTAPFSSFLSSFWTSPTALKHRTSGKFLKPGVFAFQGGFVTTPAASLAEGERRRDARRFWVALRGALWSLRAVELIATVMWGLGALGLWSVSSQRTDMSPLEDRGRRGEQVRL